MARSTSDAFKAMANAQETGEVLLALVSIDHPSIIGGPLRVVQDLQDLTSNGNVFTAFPFQVTMPEDTDDGPAKVMLTLDNIDRSMTIAIRTISPDSPPTITVQIVVASQPDVVEIEMANMTLRNIEGDAFEIKGELRMDEEDLNTFPEGSFTPQHFPGVFR